MPSPKTPKQKAKPSKRVLDMIKAAKAKKVGTRKREDPPTTTFERT